MSWQLSEGLAILTKPLECKPATISQKSVMANANRKETRGSFNWMDVNGREASLILNKQLLEEQLII